MTAGTEALVDYRGRVMFVCKCCQQPITRDDFFDLGLRVPDTDESRDDYCEAELLDEVSHLDCLSAKRAG
jgi:hypothetical protein